ncbi:antibiotic biosynthesis monooxygenase [Prauserella muralis]|uniref:Uncharacterized protein n=1 Tax=Prauserella muralis TaxID=588067 RepID=A0A2V4AHA4_9PSEU|nr:antibiotic biosynthesis monooxygenase [Prauserella muralis]PXY19275.1 hypothetical protein BAY60_31350 [Prauserella muralis]TWE29213.1 antibiotic biosynthesis monooxygenase [Prauserella muralis]
MRSTVSAQLPDVTRPDVGSVVIGSVHAGSADRQRELAEATLAEWTRAAWPDGLLSLSCFLSGDDETILLYTQWADGDAHCRWAAEASAPAAGVDLRRGVRYRLDRSIGTGGESPGCVITATFDVDGPERQRHLTDALIACSARIGPLPGAVAAHFHHSVDGSRVLNYAEWTDLAAHDAAADGADLDELYRISTETPGVRPTRGRRYRLHARL